MIVIIVICLAAITMLTPIKMGFLITTLSVWLSFTCYQVTGSVFCSSAIIISFSSGMIIILCYTAIIRNFETKNKIKIKVILPAVLGLILCIKKQEPTNIIENSHISINSIMIVVLIIIVICAIKAINQRLFTPSKSLTSSY